MDKAGSKGVFPVEAEGTDASRNKVLDVVFIHGLGGDAYTTWRADNDPDKFWPRWLAEDLRNINVWTVGYGASPSSWVEDEMPMQDRAFNLLHYFSVKKIGEKPFVLIAHSMGGLIAKYLLTSAEQENSSGYRKIADNCTDIIFLAVPHNGSEVANIFEYARLFVRRNEIVRQLQQDEAALRQLSNTFKNYVQRKNPRCLSYYETKQVRIKKQGLLGMGRLMPFGKMIVSESSAIGNFQQELPIPLEEDHISICKMGSREELLYLGIKEIIEYRISENSLDGALGDELDDAAEQRIKELDAEYQDIARKIQDISPEYENMTSRMQELLLKKEQLKSEYVSDFIDIAEWLDNRRSVLADRVCDFALEKYSCQINVGKIPKTEEEIEDFKLDVSQFIDQLESCLRQDSKDILKCQYINIGFDVDLYKIAFQSLLTIIPNDISVHSKRKLNGLIDFLLSRI